MIPPAAPPLPEPASPGLPPPTASPPELVTCDLQTVTPKRRLQGKIPSLPKDQRDIINRLLLDGATYATVIERLAQLGIALNAENISNWFQTGFQDYLAQLDRLDYQRARYEAATDLLQETDTSKLPQAGLQTAAAQIFDLLGQFAPARLGRNLADDPDKYTRIVNALSRLARETLALQKYHDACARARNALKQMLDPKRKLNESETRAIVRTVDHILGLNFDDEEETSPAPNTAEPNNRDEPSTADNQLSLGHSLPA